jgi:hypothetical protein
MAETPQHTYQVLTIRRCHALSRKVEHSYAILGGSDAWHQRDTPAGPRAGDGQPRRGGMLNQGPAGATSERQHSSRRATAAKLWLFPTHVGVLLIHR